MSGALGARGDQARKPAATREVAQTRAVNPYRLRRWVGRLGLYLSVIFLVSPAVLFFFWMLSLSLKNEVDNTAYPPVFIPHPPTFINFVKVFAENDFLGDMGVPIIFDGLYRHIPPRNRDQRIQIGRRPEKQIYRTPG